MRTYLFLIFLTSALAYNAKSSGLGSVCLVPGGPFGCDYIGMQYFTNTCSLDWGRPFVEKRDYGSGGCFAQAIMRDDSFTISSSGGQTHVQFIWSTSFYGIFDENFSAEKHVQCGVYDLC
ncbi:MAG: hypothetical protein ACLFUB_09850 [Cyclobacteriaceae bacterium]